MRKSFTTFTAATAIALTPAVVFAQDAGDADATMENENGDSEMAAVMGMMSGLFATEPLTAEEEARLPAANRVAGAMMPDGFYGKMMEKLMGSTMRPMFDIFTAPDMVVASRTGADQNTIDALSEAEQAELARILDPAYDRRADAILGTISTLMTEIGTTMEQPMREGYARAFAKRFESGQLSDIEAFFATPSGNAFASESMALFSDPEVMSSMMGSMPAMFGAMSDMEGTMEEAMNALPPERSFADLTDDERARLTAALGIDEVQLEAAMVSVDKEKVDAKIIDQE